MDPQEQVERLRRTFVPPLGLDGSRPREVILTVAGKALYLVAIALFVAALGVGIALERMVTRQSEDRQAFAQNGVNVSGEVTRLWRDSGDSKQPWASYRFEAAGQPYEGRSRIRRSMWQNLRVGSTLGVRYLPHDPRRNVVAGSEPGGIPSWVPLVAGAAFAIGGVACLLLLNSQRRLLMEGRPAPAVVTAQVKHQSSHGAHRSIKYTFPLLSGAVATGTSDTGRKSPAVGSVICVVYDPDRPRTSLPYPFALVRPMRTPAPGRHGRSVEIGRSRTSLS